MMDETATNGFDKEKTQGFVGQIEGFMTVLASERGLYMNRCRAIRESIGDVYEAAKDAGLDRKALKHEIKARERDRKSVEEFENLEADQRDQVELIRDALGDFAGTPLGQAAMAGAEATGKGRRRRKGEALDGLGA
jgi:uncharacterized protein (UPF0335 family)